jgi:NAD+ kinase
LRIVPLMADGSIPRRAALVVHPSRSLTGALAILDAWAEEYDVELVQVPLDGTERRVRPLREVAAGDLVIALGGDGTALSALRAAAPVEAPVLAVACGSVGALTAVSAETLGEALERVCAGDADARLLPALAIHTDAAPDEWAINDFVIVRRGAGQVVADVSVDGELYIRLAGDGLIVATPFGSSGYTMAAGGPLLCVGTEAFVCSPLAMHGGSGAPLVVPADAALEIAVQPTYVGFAIELDGQRRALEGSSFRVTLLPGKGRLLTFSATDQRLRRLRERGLIADSPRVLIRDERAAAPRAGPPAARG